MNALPVVLAWLCVAAAAVPSIRKCCPVAETMQKTGMKFTCVAEEIEFVGLAEEDMNLTLSSYNMVFGNQGCEDGKTKFLLNYTDNFDRFVITRDGKLEWIAAEIVYGDGEYCLDRFDNNWGAFVCQEGAPVSSTYIMGMIISIPFLALTLIVYLILPDKNIHRLCQMAYVFTLMCAYSILVYIQINPSTEVTCVVVASLCYLSFMSSFCWMNISCMDIYWTFSGKRGFGHSRKSVQRRRFLIYCGYAFGVPILFLGLIFILNGKHSWYHSNFAIGKCWLETDMALLLYFYGPMGLLLLLNIIFFALTAWKIRQINQDTAVLRREDSRKHFESDKQRFNLYLKLLLAMGINWSLEFISWLVDWLLGSKKLPEIWYATDLCNALYGVFIFFLFICKKTTWVMLQKRYYIFMGQPQKARALSTRASHYQMSQTEKTNVDESTVTG